MAWKRNNHHNQNRNSIQVEPQDVLGWMAIFVILVVLYTDLGQGTLIINFQSMLNLQVHSTQDQLYPVLPNLHLQLLSTSSESLDTFCYLSEYKLSYYILLVKLLHKFLKMCKSSYLTNQYGIFNFVLNSLTITSMLVGFGLFMFIYICCMSGARFKRWWRSHQ